ncbi:hypothetical protein TUM19329_22280 [Legionella antarctica]|uniref:Uncharacterized protein n=1 Tax=Legionella antarctica TaxID=2708020 RepID=A0A6F8T6T4_9GAMM|nr:hypothetical protein [Legionella antarctica]BCA95867.1 hypothetical protein TUM19329_22280 [Legionella antarctica]
MDSQNKDKEHPEIEDMKNICDISPNLRETKDVCDKLKKEGSTENSGKKKDSLEDSANPGNQYMPKNKKPKNLEKNGLNESPKVIK